MPRSCQLGPDTPAVKATPLTVAPTASGPKSSRWVYVFDDEIPLPASFVKKTWGKRPRRPHDRTGRRDSPPSRLTVGVEGSARVHDHGGV